MGELPREMKGGDPGREAAPEQLPLAFESDPENAELPALWLLGRLPWQGLSPAGQLVWPGPVTPPQPLSWGLKVDSGHW